MAGVTIPREKPEFPEIFTKTHKIYIDNELVLRILFFDHRIFIFDQIHNLFIHLRRHFVDALSQILGKRSDPGIIIWVVQEHAWV